MTNQYFFTYMLNKKTYKCLKKALVPYNEKLFVNMQFFLIFLVNCFGAIQVFSADINRKFIVFVTLIILGIVLYIFYKRSIYGSYRKYATKHLDKIPSVSVSFGENICVTSGGKKSEYDYSQIINIYENKNSFNIQVPDDILFLPKYALTGGDLMDFRLFIMPKQHYLTTKHHANKTAVFSVILALISILFAGILLHGDYNKTDTTTSVSNIVSRHYSDNYSIIYQHKIQDGTIAFLYDSRHNNITYCIYNQKKNFNHFERGLQYNLTEFANYNEYTRRLFWSKPIINDGNTLIYGWIDADSTLKSQLENDNISSVHFVAGDNEYILYFTEKAEV